MLTHLASVVLCAVVALVVGMAAAAGVHGADSPGALSHPAWLWNFALSAALIYMAAPLTVLGALMLRGRRLASGACVSITLGWYAVVFAAWLAATWLAEGTFPAWGWRHYAVDLLPIPLAMGLAFSVVSRAVAGPPFKR